MKVIEEILELAKVLEPLADSSSHPETSLKCAVVTEFDLSLRRGKWTAKVSYGASVARVYFVDAEANSDDEALARLRAKLTTMAENTHTWLGRLLEKFRGNLKVVK